MSAVWKCYRQMLRSIRDDKMLLAACAGPILCGLLFRFGIPALEGLLCAETGVSELIAPYYALFDLFLSMLSSMLLCFAAAMVVLEETDDHIAISLAVSPLGRRGYMLSRLGMSALGAFFYTLILLPVFHLSPLSVLEMLLLSLCGTAQGMIIALLIIAFAANKLEGMAWAKLSGLIILGVLAPYFVRGSARFLAAPLPGFFAAEALKSGKALLFLPSLLISAAWMAVLYKMRGKRDL